MGLMSSTSAMSCALECPELSRRVCEHIGTDNKRTLFRLSLSCRRFMEPALDVLWYKLDNLAPLLLCMPEDLTGEYDTTPVLERPEDDSPEQACTLFFRRSMLASDWESFEAVATRVRILDHCNWWDETIYTIDPNAFRSLACAAQGRTGLLPQLQQLSWRTSDDDIYPYIFLFLSPTITNLTVSITTGNIKSDRMRFSLLATLVSKCPSVRSVKLCSERWTSWDMVRSWRDLFSNHSSSVCASFSLWASLDYLKLQNIDLSTLTDVLAGLPVLTTLKLENCGTTNPPSPSIIKGFPMLQHLDMDSNSIESCLHVLKRMFCTPLVHLDLHCFGGASRESQWAELFSILPNGISRDTLATVSFSSSIQDNSGRPASIRLQAISPLLQFRRISEFSSLGSLDSALDLGDNDVPCIAKAWPCLKFFYIYPSRSTVVSPRLSLHALIPFAKYCPELEALYMKMQATVVDDCKEKPGEGLYDSRLQKLYVFDSPIDGPARVAAFISDVFPNLREISSIYEISGTNLLKQRWDEVERKILAAQEANRKK